MVNEEVLGGLRSALERGQTLERAMLTLFNSGYKKEDIEEAARSLLEFQPSAQLQPPVKTVPKSPVVKQTPQSITTPKPQIIYPQPTQIQKQIQPQIPPSTQKPQQQLQQPIQAVSSKPIQKVSNYGEEKQKEERPAREKAIIFILVFLMAFLLGLLAVIFLFKEQLIAYFSNFFG